MIRVICKLTLITSKEMNIQSSLRCVEWARGDIFLVGTKKSYSFFNMRSGNDYSVITLLLFSIHVTI